MAEIPQHTHQAQAHSAVSNPGGDPTNAVWAPSTAAMFASTADAAMNPLAVGNAGSG